MTTFIVVSISSRTETALPVPLVHVLVLWWHGAGSSSRWYWMVFSVTLVASGRRAMMGSAHACGNK